MGREQWNIQGGIGSIRQRGAAPVDADGDAAHQVAHADCDARPEEGKARVVAVGRVGGLALDGVQLAREDDGHDDAVDGDDLAEDDGDEVLGADARGADTAAKDGRAGDEDAPGDVLLWDRGRGGGVRIASGKRTMLRRQLRGLCRGRCPGLPRRRARRIRGRRRPRWFEMCEPRGQQGGGFEGGQREGGRSVIGRSSRAYIKRLAAAREEHICRENRSATQCASHPNHDHGPSDGRLTSSHDRQGRPYPADAVC